VAAGQGTSGVEDGENAGSQSWPEEDRPDEDRQQEERCQKGR
jgi:hypothetical protein